MKRASAMTDVYAWSVGMQGTSRNDFQLKAAAEVAREYGAATSG
jgi:uncharacterized protein (DUF1778 family)